MDQFRCNLDNAPLLCLRAQIRAVQTCSLVGFQWLQQDASGLSQSSTFATEACCSAAVHDATRTISDKLKQGSFGKLSSNCVHSLKLGIVSWHMFNARSC